MNDEQRQLLIALIDAIEHDSRADFMRFLHVNHCRFDNSTIAVCVLTMLYHHNLSPTELTDVCCDDDGEHVEIMMNEAIYLLNLED